LVLNQIPRDAAPKPTARDSGASPFDTGGGVLTNSQKKKEDRRANGVGNPTHQPPKGVGRRNGWV